MTAVRTCLACGASDVAPWRAATGEEGAYLLERCAGCGTAAVADERPPIPWNRAGGDLRPSLVEPVVEALRRVVDLDRRRLTSSLPSGARVFEVGAGDGRLLAMLAGRGHEVAGVEPSIRHAELARARGVAVETRTLEETKLEPGSRDAIVLWHVLEHLNDPLAALERVRRWLVPGGTLLVAVPNLASLQARLGGDRWFHQDVPRHRVHFTARGLRLLLHRAGFAPRRTRHVLVEQNVFGMWQTLVNRLTSERDVAYSLARRDGGEGRPVSRRDAGVLALTGLPLVPLAVALELAAGAARRGGTVVVEATAT